MAMSSYKIGKLFGIELRLHASWFLVIFLLAWSLASAYFPKYGFGPTTNWILGIAASVLLFLSVLIHEMSHSIVAKKNGIDVYSITLFFFGGIASISEENITPKKEFRVSIAGPAASLALAAIFFLVTRFEIIPQITAIFDYLWKLNLLLAAFNLAPGFPLDGGRILRSIIWGATNNLRKATEYAAKGGKILGYLLIALGFVSIILGGDGLWHIFLGIFIIFLAGLSYQQVVIKEELSGVKVRDVMEKEFELLDANLNLEKLIEASIKLRKRSFIVLSKGKIGAINIEQLERIPRKLWRKIKIGEAARLIDPINENDNAYNALKRIEKYGIGIIPAEKKGKITGIVREGPLMSLVKIKLLEEKSRDKR